MAKHNNFLLGIVGVVFVLTSVSFCQTIDLENAQLTKIADGFEFTEGPVWMDGGLLFSDIDGNKIYRWDDSTGISVFLDPSGSCNGLAIDSSGNLILAHHYSRKVTKIDSAGNQITLASEYDGKKLNSPNDLVVKSDGSIFFTDPNFGVSNNERELDFCGIYRISTTGELQLLDNSLTLPNGITFSPDESKLYVNDSQIHTIYVWDVVDDTLIANKREFVEIPTYGYADGMKVDELGNVYSTVSASGLWVFDDEGSLIKNISINGGTTNCNWGGEDGNTLFITDGDAVYILKENVTGVDEGHGYLIDDSFKLYCNYPNPFNPSTKIEFSIPRASNVSIVIYDIMGRKIRTLMDEYKAAGYYSMDFHAGNLASGTYFYRMTAEGYSMTRKMLLLE